MVLVTEAACLIQLLLVLSKMLRQQPIPCFDFIDHTRFWPRIKLAVY